MEQEWLVTLATLEPDDVIYTDYVETAKRLIPELQNEVHVYMYMYMYMYMYIYYDTSYYNIIIVYRVHYFRNNSDHVV